MNCFRLTATLLIGLSTGLGAGFASAACSAPAPPAAQVMPAPKSATATPKTTSAPAPTRTSNRDQTAPAAVATRPRLRPDCIDPYAMCPLVTGLPALSADGTQVAVPDRGPDSPRDERPLTVRILAVADGAEVARYQIVTLDDYASGYDSMTGAVAPATQATIAARIEAMHQRLHTGGYRALPALGRARLDRPSELVDGLRASFDGDALEVYDQQYGQIRWHRALAPTRAWSPYPGIECGPFPVAEIAVWAARKPGVIVAHVTYIGADACPTEYPFLVWR